MGSRESIGLVRMAGNDVSEEGVRINWDKERKSKKDQIVGAFEAAKKKVDLLLFPGWTYFAETIPGASEDERIKAILKSAKLITDLCDETGIAAIFQCAYGSKKHGNAVTMAYDLKVLHTFPRQQWGAGEDADYDPDLVQEEIDSLKPDGERRITLRGLDIGLIQCGEINFLHCTNNDNRVFVKHRLGKVADWRNYDLLFNPAHTYMKDSYGKLSSKLEYLSRVQKKTGWAVHLSNAKPASSQFKGVVKVFRNGRDQNITDPKSKRIDEVVRIETPDKAGCVLYRFQVEKNN